LCVFYGLSRLYQKELSRAKWASTWLGVGVALFQAMSNMAINGIVLAVVGHGGLLLATNQVSPGNLMAFLVATQTIQRSAVQSTDGFR
jgi:ATP-binding cassette subfamily B (MDR/TAP) protein 8